MILLRIKNYIRARARHPQGYWAVLKMGLPLIVGMASSTVMQVTDRIFLANYSLEAVAACMPAGILAFVPTALFLGIGTYTNVFIAHYFGAGAKHRIGPALWQGIYFSIFSGLILAVISLSAAPLFALSGHPANVQELERLYFSVLTLGGGLNVLMAVLGCFYSGQGRTKPIMIINLTGMLLNVPLNYMLINGIGPFPQLGILGAGLATIISWLVECLLFTALIFKLPNVRQFNLWPPALSRNLLRRLCRFGLPNGVQFMAEILAFALFVFLVGRLSLNDLAASNIAFSLNQIAFLPIIGLNVAVSTMVGQALGGGDTNAAHEATTSSLHVAMLYMGLAALALLLWPMPLLELFKPRHFSAEDFALISHTGVGLLRLVAFYCLFDSVAIVYSGALRGAGDTRFVMLAMMSCAGLFMVLPTALGILFFNWGLMSCWYSLTFYVCVLSLVYYLRFKSNIWQGIEVVEKLSQSATPEKKEDG